MKILHVITSLRTGGAEKLMVDLLPRLKTKGEDVDLLLFDGLDTSFRREVESAGIKVYDLGIGGSVYTLNRLFKLIPFLKRYDIVHTHNTAPQLFAAIDSLLTSVVLCTTEHSTFNRRRNCRLFTMVDHWMYNRYRKIICISKKAEDNLRNYIGHSKADIITINNGVDIVKYSNATASGELEKIAPGSRKIIMVAGFRWEKDQDTLIKAMKNLPAYFHLFLVGSGIRRKELEALTNSERMTKRVHFLGLRQDVPKLLHASDYVVMSSHFEGLSLSSVEGMSVGKPLLASNVDGLREVVKDAGILFEHQDTEGFANKIKELESNPSLYMKVAQLCYNRASKYDISLMADSYYNEYKKIIDNNSML